MYTIKGFMAYGALADNTVGVVAPLGELSTYGKTFSKETGLYKSDELAPAAAFISFRSYSDVAPIGLSKISPEYSNVILQIGQWLYTQAMAGSITEDDAVLYDLFTTQFAQLVGDVVLGPVATDADIWLPTWVQFRLLSDPAENRVKFWCSDDAFTHQYDEYELGFVAPIDVLDDFFKGSLQVKALVEARTDRDAFIQMENVKAKKPETFIRSESFEYIDPLDRTWRLPTDWRIIGWGIAGDNDDIVKEELIKWILENSTHSRDEWALIFPDIFTSTEFIVTPMTGQYAVANKSIQAGIYSPITSPVRATNLAKLTAKGTGYTDAYVAGTVDVMGFLYKSLALLVVGGPENRDGKIRFAQHYPDYMVIPFGTPDANRMSPATQAWVELMNRLLIVAESMDQYSDIPAGMSRITRDGVLYIAGSILRVQYLVVARSYMDTIDPPHVG